MEPIPSVEPVPIAEPILKFQQFQVWFFSKTLQFQFQFRQKRNHSITSPEGVTVADQACITHLVVRETHGELDGDDLDDVLDGVELGEHGGRVGHHHHPVVVLVVT